MSMVRMARIAGLAIALCAITAAPAHAAFFPDLTVALAPATAGGTPTLATAIVQPATDTPIERFTLTLPAGFTATGAPGASSCLAASLASGKCSAGARIGTFVGRLGANIPLGGGIYKTGPTTFGFLVSVLDGAVSQTVQGSLTSRASGALDLKLDQLPALPLTELRLGFFDGPLSLVRAPDACGAYTLDGKFTSRTGELAIDRTTMAVRGCDGVPSVLVANVRMSERRFEAGGSVYGTRTMIAWWASEQVDQTNVRVERRVDGVWRRVGTLVATGWKGNNSVRWDGRLKGRELKPGRYALRVQPAGSVAADRVGFRIIR
jgi:hypothetical protein